MTPLAAEARVIRDLPEDTSAEVEEKQRRFVAAEAGPDCNRLRLAADLQAAAFLLSKTGGMPANRSTPDVPTTAHLRDAMAGRQVYGPLVERAQNAAAGARAFHWPLAFPDVFVRGGFDAVLGNPPWDVVQLDEEEYFAQRLPEVAALAGVARKCAITALERDRPELFAAYRIDKRRFEASNEFTRSSGRFDLSARGKINTYALFAELFVRLINPYGRAGVVVPTGIATDANTALFFSSLIRNSALISLFSFFEIRKIFPDTDDRSSFCLLTIGNSKSAAPEFAFQLVAVANLKQLERRFMLSAADFASINPNTRTAPLFRSRGDAELTAKIYAHMPVLIDEARGRDGNPWRIEFRQGLFNMTSDSSLFRTGAQLSATGCIRRGTDWERDGGNSGNMPERYVPLYEAKMVHQFDHRWATYDDAGSRDATMAEHANPAFEVVPRYWVPKREVDARLADKGWTRGWLMGWRDIARATDERTTIFSITPRVAVGHTSPLIFSAAETRMMAALYVNLNAIVLDFIARQKVGGTHLTYGYLNQFAVLPPQTYTPADLAFIVPRVLELTYTSYSMASFARDLGFDGTPFAWDEGRRAWLRAELDAHYAHLYGLTRDELRNVLDQAVIRGPDYPSETFRVLKANEVRRFGEYRTARLVLAAWDADTANMRAAAE